MQVQASEQTFVFFGKTRFPPKKLYSFVPWSFTAKLWWEIGGTHLTSNSLIFHRKCKSLFAKHFNLKNYLSMSKNLIPWQPKTKAWNIQRHQTF